MRLGHFHALEPVCPACRKGGDGCPLLLRDVEEEHGDVVRFGVLACDACGTRFPILDGLPVLVPDLNRFLADNLFYLMARDDLTPNVLALIGDAAGPGSGLDALQQHVSSYGWDHWSDLDPQEVPSGPVEAGQARRLMRLALEGLPSALEEGPILDIGCGAGRTVLELAEARDRLVLGVDLSVPLARLAQGALVEGRVAYNKRRGGLFFEHHSFDVSGDERADVWIADALALPFADDRFAMITALNVLDCVADPRAMLAEFGRIARPGGACAVATPFDWSSAATPYQNWLGTGAVQGGGQKGARGWRSDIELEDALGDGPNAAGALRRSRPPAEAEWQVRLHDRSALRYVSQITWSTKVTAELAA